MFVLYDSALFVCVCGDFKVCPSVRGRSNCDADTAQNVISNTSIKISFG